VQNLKRTRSSTQKKEREAGRRAQSANLSERSSFDNHFSDLLALYFDSSGNAHGFLLSKGKFMTIGVPGAIFTDANGINPQGDISGDYTDSSGNAHAFLLRKGKFTTIDVPGAVRTDANEINPRGEIVGDYFDSRGNDHGFLLSK
jgi:uncharacterized membrane protein